MTGACSLIRSISSWGERPVSDSNLRIVLLVQVITQSGFSLVLVRHSRATASVFSRREEGVALSVMLGVFYIAYCGGIIVYLIEPARMVWGAVTSLPLWCRWTGVLPLVVGTTIAMWGLRTLGRHFALSVSPQEGNVLIRSGPYNWVRHPLYTAGIMEAAGISLMMGSWFVALMAVLLWGGIIYRTPMEEEKLIERHGDIYREYIAATGRFSPRFTSYRRKRIDR